MKPSLIFNIMTLLTVLLFPVSAVPVDPLSTVEPKNEHCAEPSARLPLPSYTGCTSPTPKHTASTDQGTTPWTYPIDLDTALDKESRPGTRNYAPIHRGFDAPAQRWLPGHRGVDFVVDATAKVVAPIDGTVTFSGKVFNRHSITVTNADGFKNSFEPVRSPLRIGDIVKAGDVIGYFTSEDSDQSHCLPQLCVHWGVRNNSNEYQNPLFFLQDKTRSVLLPYLSDR